MNDKEIRLLSKMKELIVDGKRKFQTRKDRDYLQDLLDLGITEESAWNDHIISLNSHFYYNDPKPSYLKDGESLIFKKRINGILAYIKLKIENNYNVEEIVVCISFHRDEKYRNGG